MSRSYSSEQITSAVDENSNVIASLLLHYNGYHIWTEWDRSAKKTIVNVEDILNGIDAVYYYGLYRTNYFPFRYRLQIRTTDEQKLIDAFLEYYKTKMG